MWSHIKPEQGHIAVLHDILFSFTADQAFFLAGGHAAQIPERFEGNDLGTDEAALEIGVDLAGCLRRLGALGDGPGAALVLAAGQEGNEAQQVVAGADQTVQTAPADAQVIQELLFSSSSIWAISSSICALMTSTSAPSAFAASFTSITKGFSSSGRLTASSAILAA